MVTKAVAVVIVATKLAVVAAEVMTKVAKKAAVVANKHGIGA